MYAYVQLEASSSDCEQMVRACLPYLSRNMPAELQEICVHAITVLARRHADNVWILLAQMCPPASIPSLPHSSLVPIKVKCV